MQFIGSSSLCGLLCGRCYCHRPAVRQQSPTSLLSFWARRQTFFPGGGYGSSPSRRGPSSPKGLRPTRRSPGSRTRSCVHARFFDHAGSPKRLRWRSWTCCLPLHRQRRHPESVFYRGSMAGLHVPLPTLRRHPHGCLRTARGRCGSLLLHRGGLSPPTPCRSPGALRSSPETDILSGRRYVSKVPKD